MVARLGVKLASVSQTAVQELIELQSDALTAAITEFAQRLERAAQAASVIELIRDQVHMLPRLVPGWRATPDASFRS